MTTLKAGDNAPDFSGINENEEKVSLKDFKGQKLVLYFYPKDDTPGCTAEACDLRDNYQSFIKHGYVILGVSPDKPAKHRKFIAKYKLPFSLLADEDHSIAESYGVWGQKTLFGVKYIGVIRTTFVIDENGKIERVIDKVETSAHTKQILN